MSNRNVIYFDHEGDFSLWEQTCLPIGNGYLGASMFGGMRRERIVFNEKTLWAGGPCENRPYYYGGNKRDKYKYVKQVQEELKNGSYDKVLETLPELTGDGDFGSYLLLCDMVLDFNVPNGQATDYRRQLDLDRSLYSCEFSIGGVKYTREAFASYPARVVAMKFTASEKGRLEFIMGLEKTHPCDIYMDEDGLISYSGYVADNGMRFDARVLIQTDGEVLTVNGRLAVKDATEAILYLTAATDYEMKYPDYRTGADPSTVTIPIIQAAYRLGWDALYEEHLADYSAIFGRVELDINSDYDDLPADRLIEAYRRGERAAMNKLETLYFQYGRYLLISSSREGSLPANLQGVWNESNTPPWCCDYHINVNLQMNYWGAYNTNMAETVPPLVDFLDSLREPGRVTAKEYYNIVSDEEHPENGWTAHTQCSPFGWTAPGWDFYWGWSTAAVAWLMQNIWEHYEFTADRDYLREIYPVLAGSCRFLLDYLCEAPEGYLTTSPSNSPENSFFYTEPDGTRRGSMLTHGATIDFEIIYALFTRTAYACDTLGEDPAFADELKATLDRLPPLRVSEKYGILCEWIRDYDEVEPGHRHVSPLFGLHPADQINETDPAIFEAARNTLTRRLTYGGEGGAGCHKVGWSQAWMINFFARFKDGEAAFERVQGLLQNCTADNLLDFHPPQLFQIDGNLGGAAGMAEMLVQSHLGTPDSRIIELLPALPKAWPAGYVKGIKARGNITIDMAWKDGKLTEVTILSPADREVTVRMPTNGQTATCDLKAGHPLNLHFD